MKYISHIIFSILFFLLLCGCATIKKIDFWPFNNKGKDQVAATDTIEQLGGVVEPTTDNSISSSPQSGVYSYDPLGKIENPNQIIIKYKNNSSDVTLILDPQDNDVEIEVAGEQNSYNSNKSEEIYWGNQNELSNADGTRKIVQFLRESQEAFYEKDYDKSMKSVNNALAISPTAEAYALKGSIYYMQGKIGNAKLFWEKTLEMNQNIAGINEMLQKLKRQGF